MAKYSITNRISGEHLGTFVADSEQGARDALARDAGYRDAAQVEEQIGDDGRDLDVVRCEEATEEEIAAARAEYEVALAAESELFQAALAALDGKRMCAQEGPEAEALRRLTVARDRLKAIGAWNEREVA